jgi:hypothetical protein
MFRTYRYLTTRRVGVGVGVSVSVRRDWDASAPSTAAQREDIAAICRYDVA